MSLPYKFKVQSLIEDKRITQSDLDDIKNWLKTTTLPQLQEEFIALFLVSCLNDIPKTRNAIQAYFRIKNGAPNLFNDCDPDREDVQQAIKLLGNTVIPTRMDNNIVVIFARFNDTDYRNFCLVPIVKLSCMFVDLCQIYDPANEMIVIVDMKGIGFMHLTCMNISIVRTFLDYVQHGMPLKIRNIHILNTNYVFDKLLALFRVFVKHELLATIVTHPPGMSMEQFQKDWVPATYLPKEYDGKLPTVDELNSQTIDQLRQQRSFFIQEEKLRSLYK